MSEIKCNLFRSSKLYFIIKLRLEEDHILQPLVALIVVIQESNKLIQNPFAISSNQSCWFGEVEVSNITTPFFFLQKSQVCCLKISFYD